MIKYVLAATAVLFSVSANAATFTVKSYSNHDDVYIHMNGATEKGDYDRYITAYNRAKADHRWDGAIYFFKAPGGLAHEGEKIANHIRKNKLNTFVNDSYCISACSLMWMAGNYRNIRGEDGYVGFHFAYTDNLKYLEEQKDLRGWFGVQDMIAQSSHYYTAQLLKFDVAKPYEFVIGLAKDGGIDSAFWLHSDNIDIVGKGRNVFTRKAKPKAKPAEPVSPTVKWNPKNYNLWINNMPTHMKGKEVLVQVYDRSNKRLVGIYPWNKKWLGSVNGWLRVTVGTNRLLDLGLKPGHKPYKIVVSYNNVQTTYYL